MLVRYSSHIAGKWHLGHFKRIYTPLYRGFRSHVGYWTGHQDYYDHTAVEQQQWGLDMRNGRQISQLKTTFYNLFECILLGTDVAYSLHGRYTTDVITDEAVRVIAEHNQEQPLFLYVAHAAVHSANPYNPLPASDEDVNKMNHINEYRRRKYAGRFFQQMVTRGIT